MLIIALVLALIGLVALVFAVVTSNEVVAWACIVASVLGVVLLIIDAVRERQRGDAGAEGDGQGADEEPGDQAVVDYPEEVADAGDVGAQPSAAESSAPEESAVPAEHSGDESPK